MALSTELRKKQVQVLFFAKVFFFFHPVIYHIYIFIISYIIKENNIMSTKK